MWETEKSLPERMGKGRGSTVDPTLGRPAGLTLGLFLFENLIVLVGKIFMKIYDISFIKTCIYTHINRYSDFIVLIKIISTYFEITEK